MKTWWTGAGLLGIGILLGLLATGGILLVSSQPRGEAVRLSPPPTISPIMVHISGAVVHPGVYSLPPGCRIRDVVEAAGGLLPEANMQLLNLAAFIQDGEQIIIASKLPTPLPASPADLENPETHETPAAADLPLNINTATLEQLDMLPGIGPEKARRIIDYRETYGPFATVEAIQKVSGIGPATFEKIKALITIASAP